MLPRIATSATPEEYASERWWYALAMSTGELSSVATLRVILNSHSLAMTLTAANQAAFGSRTPAAGAWVCAPPPTTAGMLCTIDVALPNAVCRGPAGSA